MADSIFHSSEQTHLPVTIDKSHLVAIGERLYSESVELLRELVNNAYDADATEVNITLTDHEIEVQDNGSGMDLEGLKQYFNIGGSPKKRAHKSPVFKRNRIGEFGIGKFSTLSASDHFEVSTQKGNFAATVVFDRKDWEASQQHWRLPLHLEAPQPDKADGARVVLRDLKKTFDVEIVRRRLLEILPLHAENFHVLLNGTKLEPYLLEGQRMPFLEGTPYGVISGELIIRPASRLDVATPGVLVRIKQVAVARLPFNLSGESLQRITGDVNADFLPITSDRSGFIRDSEEFRAFEASMSRILTEAKKKLSHLSDQKENRRVKRALKEVMDKIQTALLTNTDWCPPGWLPKGTGSEPGLAEADKKPDSVSSIPTGKSPQEGQNKAPPKKKKPRLKQLTPSAMLKKLKLGNMGFALVLDHFGPERAESFTEGEIIYINRDHPLYIREAAHKERHIMHVARLIGQEIALLSRPRTARQAFERQSRLLRDAFRSK